MDLRYTRWQTARGARPDAVRSTDRYLIKNVSTLRLTYQIRLLTIAAQEDNGRLLIQVPKSCRLSRDLRTFTSEHKQVRVQKVS